MKKKLTLIKVGGKIVEEASTLKQLLQDFSEIEGYKILVHGGGRSATKIAEKLGIESKMLNGRRITDADTLQVVTMVYGGLVNKNIVARLQALGLNALGLTGADLDIIRSDKRPVKDVDYGFVGDVKKVKAETLKALIDQNITPIIAPLTHDGNGNMLNTNADTIAAETAQTMAEYYDVSLVFCFEKKGVLLNENDDNSVIPELDKNKFEQYMKEGIVQGGMIPKLENAFHSLEKGVKEVIITQASDIGKGQGTRII
ncbi:MAG: acetylglutamate kinase [Dysgonomonas sp.]|nr:acetylglutamate kinase [Dysgonomonas sp.]